MSNSPGVPLTDYAANTQDMHRRTFLTVALGVTISLCPGRPSRAAEIIRLGGRLCSLYVTLSSTTVSVESSTGDTTLDRQLALEAQRIARAFDVRPGLKIIVAPSPYTTNALATNETHVENTKGTVMLGRDLLFEELQINRRGWGGLTVAGLMAHEFAHVLQFFSGYRERLMKDSKTVQPVELHADFLAGYHLGLKRREGASMDIGAFMDGIYFKGDAQKQDQQHHGTQEERRRAVREGYRTGVKGHTPVSVAAEMGVESIKRIMGAKL